MSIWVETRLPILRISRSMARQHSAVRFSRTSQHLKAAKGQPFKNAGFVEIS